MNKPYKVILVSVFVGLLSFFYTNKAMAQGMNYKAFAVFVYNFARYTEWPGNAVNNTEIKFAVLGNCPIYEELAQVLPTKNINGKKCRVDKIDNASQLRGYHVVFIPALKSGQLDDVLKVLGTGPTMVITENDGLVKKGADISFVITDAQKLRFELNEETLKARNLRIASELKNLAL